MNILYLTFYLILAAIFLEVIKIVKRKQKKSIIVNTAQLLFLVLSLLIIVKFVTNKIFALIPVLILAILIIDWFQMESGTKAITLRLKLVVIFCLILTGLILIVYGMVKA